MAIGCAAQTRLPQQPTQPASAHNFLPEREPPDIPIIADDDYVVRVVADEITCSGTLIAPDQVLTAHHCVAQRSGKGDIVDADISPDQVRVELGGGYLPWGEVQVRWIVAPPCGFAAGVGDIAILVLDRALGEEVGTLPPRLDEAPKIGDSIEPVGFGLCPASEAGIRRKSRQGGRLDALRASRFRLDASICPGDSGGPALSSTGDLVGVISASAMDGSEATVGRSEFTRLDHWRPVFSNAKLISEGASPAEVPPLAGCPEPDPG
jgi:V8-like Glu-specific endopeptidase